MPNSYGVGNTYLGADYTEYLNDQRMRKTQLGKNDFLYLLTAQMKYQNPLEPLSDTDFIAQMAQFSALEQMEAMSTAMIAMQAYNMVGKLVSANNVLCDDGLVRNIDGYVEFVVLRDGGYFARVGDYLLPVSKITDIFDKQSISPDNPLIGAAHLIGCTVKAYEVEVVDGRERILYQNGEPRLDNEGNVLRDELGAIIYEQTPKYRSGVVTGLAVVDNVATAYIKAADGAEYTAAVNHIFDIRQSLGEMTNSFTEVPDTEEETPPGISPGIEILT